MVGGSLGASLEAVDHQAPLSRPVAVPMELYMKITSHHTSHLAAIRCLAVNIYRLMCHLVPSMSRALLTCSLRCTAKS